VTRILLATKNPNKLREFREIIRTDIEWVLLPEEAPEVEEDGNTFCENATKKAREYGGRAHLPTVAEDSGLEVDALGGEPGVFSARFAGCDCNAESNNRLLLDKLKGVEEGKRSARFVCCLVYWDGVRERVFEGEIRGRIALACSGTNGFGYDPLFIPEGYETTFAQMPSETKNSISHRFRAIQQLSGFLDPYP